MNKEKIKEIFIKNINDSYTLNLAVSVLEDLELSEQKIHKAIDYINNNMLYKYKYDEEELFEVITSEYSKQDLLKILGEDNE